MKKNEEETVETENKELQSVEIAKIEAPKQGNIFGLIAFFLILLVFVVGLPYMGDIIDRIKGVKPEVNDPSLNNNTPKEPEDNIPEDVLPIHLDSASFTVNDLEFTNFRLDHENSRISFDVETPKEQGISLLSSNIFLQLYSADNTLLERVLVEKNTIIAKGSGSTFTFPISENSNTNVINVLVLTKSVDDYLNISLSKDGEGVEFLICATGDRKITYYFEEAKLNKIDDIDIYKRNDDNFEAYSELISSKRNEASAFNNRSGITSVVQETLEGFTMTTKVDLTIAEVNKQAFPLYYPKETLAKVISFEMEARGYNCN